MRAPLVFLIVCCAFKVIGQQQEGKVWLQTGIKQQINKDWEWSVDLTNRFGNTALETFFSQVSIKYKLTKWFRPSLDYRSILDKDKFRNYTFSNRLNLNADLKHQVKRWGLGLRVRYQYSFHKLTQSSYDAEFDQAIRLKPQVSYNIKKSVFRPICTLEMFFNPSYHPNDRLFTKYRLFAGAQLDLKGPHDFSFGYIFDQELFIAQGDTKHILNLTYSLNLSGFKKSENLDKKSGGGDLFND